MLETLQMIKRWWGLGLAAALGLFVASCSWGFYSYPWDYQPTYTVRGVYLVDTVDSAKAYARLARSELIRGDIQGVESRSDGLFLVIEVSSGDKILAQDNFNQVESALIHYVATLPSDEYGAIRGKIDSSMEVSSKPDLGRKLFKSILLGLGLGMMAFVATCVASQAIANELRLSCD